MKFDKKFVYCVWDDVLIGKEVVAACCISSLITKVEHDDDYCMLDTCICIGCNENVEYPFKVRDTYDEDALVESHSFVYYDPNYRCKIAHECGKQIQYLYNNEWHDVDIPTWDDITTYRVKPDVPEPKYRPYKDIDEFVFEHRTKSDNFGEPLVLWVKEKDKDEAMIMCDGLNRKDNKVRVECVWRSMAELLEEYTYLDGTPLGVEE